ncbi:MAG: 3-dehydroquinate dehydratase [Actinobacteria bacterium]|nr:3-dehydroquinate dehydratase [Actinomycetota bacterium]MCA1720055.1 3-dehydroquinate dehydratase [Actinomycetota bacterium]
MRVLVLNGPNLGRLGSREPEVYGSTTYDGLVQLCKTENPEADVRQTDDEATMIGWLHEAADSGTPVVLNSAAWSHYSYALRDACSQLTAPLIEVHISQTAARDEFRHASVVSGVATGTITGLGVDGYRLALSWLANRQ